MDTKTTHPLILIAAGSVTIASLAAAAHFTGLLPTRAEPAPQIAAVASAPIAAPQALPAPVAATPAAEPQQTAPARKPAVKPVSHRAPLISSAERDDSYQRRVSTNQRDADNGIDVLPGRMQTASNNVPSVQPPPAPPVCHECGTVESVREQAVKGEGSGLGAVAGGVLGGLLGNQAGRGKGRDVMTVLGAVGGAFGGHQVEKMVRTEKQYEISVRFDDGSVRNYTQASAQWHPGDRVRAANGSLSPL